MTPMLGKGISERPEASSERKLPKGKPRDSACVGPVLFGVFTEPHKAASDPPRGERRELWAGGGRSKVRDGLSSGQSGTARASLGPRLP